MSRGYGGEMTTAFPLRSRGSTEDLVEIGRPFKAELHARLGPAAGSLVGLGFGAKSVGRTIADGQLAVRVYVRAKRARRELSAAETIPDSVNGMQTDVIAVGDVAARARPTLCGVSIGHPAVTAGTMGCLVRRRGSGAAAIYILFNNHVMANCNEGAAGDAILEPALMDGGDPNDPIAELTDFEPLLFGGPVNLFDAAIARVLDPAEVDPRILAIGAVGFPVVAPVLYQSVRKRGRTTLHTLGAILDVSADVRVRYDTRVAFFEDQIAISGTGGAFSDTGDSGSLVVDAVTRRPVALLFSGGIDVTFASPIQPVLDCFGMEIL
jgi:hypothetical protein